MHLTQRAERISYRMVVIIFPKPMVINFDYNTPSMPLGASVKHVLKAPGKLVFLLTKNLQVLYISQSPAHFSTVF